MSRSWSRYRDYGYYDFPVSVALPAKGGIKAQAKRGTLGGSNWWAKRWIGILESFNIGARLGRGRSYARMGQVLSVEVGKGEVKAEVQGSRAKPYSVSIRIAPIAKKDWRQIVETLSGQVLYVAKLLAGQMPEDIESVFDTAKLSLFPNKLKDIQTECSCPDWSNPCKHIAAVYYLLGEEFDRDPFLMFKLRGLSRDELITKLGAAAGPGAAPALPARLPDESAASAGETGEPLATGAGAFWDLRALPDDFYGKVEVPSGPAALPKSMGDFPFWRANEPFIPAMEKTYAEASRLGMSVFLGEQAMQPPEDDADHSGAPTGA
ncbi:MAG: SWIM zinc finger family protein [bacterium]|nr:SWIM zinc finger family protein [Candidatus Sumerlaeota bacterium]